MKIEKENFSVDLISLHLREVKNTDWEARCNSSNPSQCKFSREVEINVELLRSIKVKSLLILVNVKD